VTGTPAHLHVFWDGPPLPDEYKRHLWLWTEMHPSWGFTLWDDQAYQREFSDTDTIDFYRQPGHWSPRSNVWQWRTNIARYEILHRLGGVWVDVDMEPRKPITHLLGGSLVAAWERQDVWINNALMVAPPGHDALAAILAGLPSSVRAGRHRRSNWVTGARYITPILRRRQDVTVLDQALVYPYNFRELHRAGEPFPDALMVHHWANARRRLADLTSQH
jgi:mannosyltransferase OCH1-like enzyme